MLPPPNLSHHDAVAWRAGVDAGHLPLLLRTEALGLRELHRGLQRAGVKVGQRRVVNTVHTHRCVAIPLTAGASRRRSSATRRCSLAAMSRFGVLWEGVRRQPQGLGLELVLVLVLVLGLGLVLVSVPVLVQELPQAARPSRRSSRSKACCQTSTSKSGSRCTSCTPLFREESCTSSIHASITSLSAFIDSLGRTIGTGHDISQHSRAPMAHIVPEPRRH